MLFAGVRFVAAGILTIILSVLLNWKVYHREETFTSQTSKESAPHNTIVSVKSIGGIFLLGIVQTFLQYFFYYIGMAHVSGAKGAIINGASAIAFTLWTILLKYHSVGQVTVFNFLIPVFGTLLSALVLHDNVWNIRIVLSLPLVCIGVFLVNSENKVRSSD